MSAPYHKVAVELRRAASVVVGAHVNPDGDAVGSVLGLTIALHDAGIAALPVLADEGPGPSTYSFLPGFALLASAEELAVPDVFVAIDTPNLDRLGAAAPLARDARRLIVIDHHPDNSAFGSVNLLDPGASACAQMIWRLLRRLEVEPTAEVALCLYVGLLTDTGRFQYNNTTPAALRDAAEMIEAGADPADTARLVYENRSSAAMALDARTLSRLTLANDGRVAYAWIDEVDFAETGAQADETEHLIDEIRVLGGIDVAALLRIRDTEVRVNLRSKTGYDVGSVARTFGGGGHAAAAGFSYSGTMDQLLAELLPRLPGAAR